MHTKEGGSEQKIAGDVSLGVVTGVRAESASDSGAVLHNETQQSLYLGDSSNLSLSLLFLPLSSHLIFSLYPPSLSLSHCRLVFPPLFHPGTRVN